MVDTILEKRTRLCLLVYSVGGGEFRQSDTADWAMVEDSLLYSNCFPITATVENLEWTVERMRTWLEIASH